MSGTTPYVPYPDTWNPSDTSSGLVLSNSNLSVADGSSPGGNMLTRSVVGLGSGAGKFYFEFTSSEGGGGDSAAGMALGTATGDQLESDAQNAVLKYYGYGIYEGGSNTGRDCNSYTTFLAIAVDLDAGLIWFNASTNPASPVWMGSSSYDPGAGTGGLDISGLLVNGQTIFPVILVSGNGPVPITANFGATPMVGVVPTGFTAGWPAPAPADGSGGSGGSGGASEALVSQLILEAVGQNSSLGVEASALIAEVVARNPGTQAAVSNVIIETIWKPVVAIRVAHWNSYRVREHL